MPVTTKREKKVGFSPTLSPIDSEARAQSPVNSGITWDTETGGDGLMHSHTTVPDFASQGGSTRNRSSSHDEKRDENASDDDDIAPPTPSVQHFYAGARKKDDHGKPSAQPAPSVMNSSSNSSLPSMAAALVSGGPMVQQKLHQTSKASTLLSTDSFSQENPSPLSPAALIGTPQENMLLPPPGGAATTVQFQQAVSANAASASQQRQRQQQPPPIPQHPSHHPAHHQQHMAWLSDINARARSASAGQQQQQQPVVFMPPGAPHVGMHPGMMGYYPHMMPQHANPYLFAAAMAQQHREQKNPVESEEKRVKRLERNRESARKSRRKKKERLATLEAQVNKLHQEIDTERRHHIGTMVEALKRLRMEEVQKLSAEADKSQLHAVIRYTGPCSSVSRSVLDYQYNRLRQVTLPGYQKFVLWSVMRDVAFFTMAKEEYARRETSSNNQQSRPATSKVSSKQIGEELFAAGTRVDSNASDARERAAGQFASSYANDNSKTWPLFSSELKLSVDQEEKFLYFRRKMRQIPDLDNVQSQMNAAVQTAESLRYAVHSVSRAVAQREETTYLSVLTPSQTAAYQGWLARNRQVCRAAVSPHQRPDEEMNGPGVRDTSLHDICRRLNEVLRISKPS